MRGEVTVLPDADDLSCFDPGSVLHAGDDAARSLVIASSRAHRDGLVLAFEGIGTRDAAEALRGALLTIPSTARRALGDGEFWPEDLVGLVAVDQAGRQLGEVTGVELGNQDRLVVTTPAGRRVLVPFVADLVGDPEAGRIAIRPPEGLFDLH